MVSLEIYSLVLVAALHQQGVNFCVNGGFRG